MRSSRTWTLVRRYVTGSLSYISCATIDTIFGMSEGDACFQISSTNEVVVYQSYPEVLSVSQLHSVRHAMAFRIPAQFSHRPFRDLPDLSSLICSMSCEDVSSSPGRSYSFEAEDPYRLTGWYYRCQDELVAAHQVQTSSCTLATPNLTST